MPLIPVLRQSQVDLCELVVYRANSRAARAVTQRNLSRKKQNKTKTRRLKGFCLSWLSVAMKNTTAQSNLGV